MISGSKEYNIGFKAGYELANKDNQKKVDELKKKLCIDKCGERYYKECNKECSFTEMIDETFEKEVKK